jgi:large subunit ribosomal protein L21
MFAVFETGGKQYKAQKGGTLRVEKIQKEEGEEIEFPRIFLVADGEAVTVGTPFVEGASVRAKIVRHNRDKKVRVVKFQSKKRRKSLHGHRQHFTDIEILEVSRETKEEK